MDDSAITCNKIRDTDVEAKLNSKTKSNNEETKTFPTNFNAKTITYKTQKLYFTNLFINYHCIIDSC